MPGETLALRLAPGLPGTALPCRCGPVCLAMPEGECKTFLGTAEECMGMLCAAAGASDAADWPDKCGGAVLTAAAAS